MAKKNEKNQNKVEAKKNKAENIMRKVKLEKVVLNCGGTEDKLEKSAKLLNLLTGKTIRLVISRKRIPSLGVRPGLKTGCMVTIRDGEAEALLKKLLEAVNKKIKYKQIANNGFSFGIKEYLEIPDMEYRRDIGILGLDVTAVFARAGRRVALKKIKMGKLPKKQIVSREEIREYAQNKLGIEVEEAANKGEKD